MSYYASGSEMFSFVPAVHRNKSEVLSVKDRAKWVCVCCIVGSCVLVFSYLGSMAVTVMSENMPIERAHTIVIDAGHGGEDGGASSYEGIPESTYNLSIATRLESLCHLLGIDTLMIRRTDISVYTEGDTIAAKKRSDLKERVRMVNDTSNSVLLSIHQNNFPDGRYSGAQVFYANTPGSKLLAEKLQSSLVSTLNPGSSRSCKRANAIYLMEHIRQPGILIECGFLSNAREEALLRSADYQKKLVCVIAAAVKEFLSEEISNT